MTESSPLPYRMAIDQMSYNKMNIYDTQKKVNTFFDNFLNIFFVWIFLDVSHKMI